MRRNHISAPHPCAQTLSALALLASLAVPAGFAAPAFADETQDAEQGAQAAADQDTQATEQTAQSSGAATSTSTQALAQPLSVKSLSWDSIEADEALQGLVAQNSLAVDVSLTNDTAAVQAFYAALNDMRSQVGSAAIAQDADLETAAWQRVAESVLARSDIRPDGTAFNTANERIAAEVLVWGSATDGTDAKTVLATLVSSDDYATQAGWLMDATNIGCACVRDADGNVSWAIELSFDGAAQSQAQVASGEATYTVNVAAANVTNVTLPEKLEMKSGDVVQPSVEATVEGTLWFGPAGYSYDFTGAKVAVKTGGFIWNSANTSIVSATADGTLTAIKAGTVTISATDADGSNPRFGVVVVDGGAPTAAYDLGTCTIVGITGEDGKGNFYLNDQGTVTMPNFNVMAPDGTVIDPVNYTATINYNERTSIAVLTVKASSKSELCSGIVTRQLTVVDPAKLAAQQAAAEAEAQEAQASEDAAGSEGETNTQDDQTGEADSEDSQDTEGSVGQADTQDGQAGVEGTNEEGAEDSQNGEGDAGEAGDQGSAGEIGSGDGQEAEDTDASSTGADGETDQGEAGTADESTQDGTAADASNAEAAGPDAATLPEGTGDAQGTGDVEAITTTKDISQGQLTLSFSSLTYTGSPIQATGATLTVGGTTLTEGTDYTLSYSDNVKVGTATATATGIGACTGSLKTTFDIAPADMSLTSVTMPNLPYTGQAMSPQPKSVTYEVDGVTTELVVGVDYQVVGFTNNTNIGDATIVLQGMGNFTGTLIANWKIVQQGTGDAGTTLTIPQTADPTDLAGMAAFGIAGSLFLTAAGALFARMRRDAARAGR